MIKRVFVFAVVAALSLSYLVAPLKVSALSGSEFQAGSIIDDGVFFNASSMDQSSIQSFLNSKVPACDTWGTKPRGGVSRASYGTSQGYPPPYTCLKDYSQDTPTRAADTLCNQYNGGTKPAAQIINDVAQACGISSKVMLILLEKEQSLITDDWPWSNQYRSATGYGCPDTAPCDAEFYGFFNQVYNAARQFKRYARDSYQYSYRSGRQNYIQYNPVASCGGSNVLILNQATAGLYNYTPYQPNAAALANLNGSGDSCSAYGNRNFWVLFSNWFGSTRANCTFPTPVQGSVYRLYNKPAGTHLLTTSSSEVCVATSMGYLYDGPVFTSPSGAANPVYRLQKNGHYLFTGSAAERDNAVNGYGFKLEGVAFNGADSASPTALPVYRLVNSGGGYTYTISPAERDSLANGGFRYEGVTFALEQNAGATTVPTYRAANPNGSYLFTIYSLERDAAVQYYGYRAEGVGFNSGTQLTPSTLPLYRLAGPGGYLYTSSLAERVHATNIGYRDENIQMYSYGAYSGPSLNEVFRLARSGSYFYTQSAAERDSAAKYYGFRVEGVGFLEP